jgi:hypothetical protein
MKGPVRCLFNVPINTDQFIRSCTNDGNKFAGCTSVIQQRSCPTPRKYKCTNSADYLMRPPRPPTYINLDVPTLLANNYVSKVK